MFHQRSTRELLTLYTVYACTRTQVNVSEITQISVVFKFYVRGFWGKQVCAEQTKDPHNHKDLALWKMIMSALVLCYKKATSDVFEKPTSDIAIRPELGVSGKMTFTNCWDYLCNLLTSTSDNKS